MIAQTAKTLPITLKVTITVQADIHYPRGVDKVCGLRYSGAMARSKKTTRRKRPAPKPGQFSYGGGTVFEIDNNGKARPRPEIGPDHKGAFKNKFFKKPAKNKSR